VFVKDATSLRFERFNRAGEELLGLSRSELIGRSDYDFFPREQADFFVAKDREVLERRALLDIPEEPIETPRGTRWLHTRKIPVLDDAGEPRYLLGVSLDITERKLAEEALRASHGVLERSVARQSVALQREIEERQRAERALARLEEERRQSQRLEAIGRLAGGVAHDFNNVLCVVLGYCDSIGGQLIANDPLRKEVDEIRRAAERAGDLTRQLLAFSRRQVLHPRVVDLNVAVGEMQGMLQRLVGEDIALNIRTAASPAYIKADPSQIEQVIMNLVVNARDAMPTGGQLTIEIDPVELDASFVATHLGSQRGPHVRLAVSDTGEGMVPETLAHLFEPFYTTKETGKGTGLGLSTVFGIVKQSEGSIFVYSEPGQGTTFKLYFPATGEAPVAAEDLAGPSVLRGSETILLVEDEPQLRTLAASILGRQGYNVLTCAGAAEALARAEARGEIDLLLTDVVMPEMSGRTLSEQIRSRRPGIRVLFMSGYADEAVLRHGVLESSMEFLQKPFTAAGLARRVRAALDAPARSA
jgi:PAS domain S-box-containing protein